MAEKIGFSGVTYKFRDGPGILLLWSLMHIVIKSCFITGCLTSIPSTSFYSKRHKPSRIASLIKNVSCDSEEESDDGCDDFEDPDYNLPVDQISDDEIEETETELPVSEIITNPQVKCTKSTKSRKTRPDHPNWDKIASRDGTSPLGSLLFNQDADDYAEMSPMDYFKSFIPDKLLEKICDQSNNYSMQNDINKPLSLQREELEQWLGIAMQMTLTKVSNTRGHWSHHSFRQNISSIMTRQR